MSKLPTAFHDDHIPVAVGRSTIAWNTLSLAIFGIFETLSGLDRNVAKSMFFGVKSDRTQRDLVTELVNLALNEKHPQLAKAIRRQLSTINTLAGRRNDVAHVVYHDDHVASQTTIFHDIGFLKGKAGMELVEAIHNLTIECLDCANSLQKLHLGIWETDDFRRKIKVAAFAKAILDNQQQVSPGSTTASEFGLLGVPATMQHPLAQEED